MSNAQLEIAIEAAWDTRDTITPATTGETRDAIETTLNALDSGKLRVAEKQETGDWHVNQWAKKAVLLGFRLKDMELQAGSAQGGSWWDKVDSKWAGWGTDDWTAAGFRAVPNCVVRKSAYIAPGVVLMPSFVNLGAYVDSGTMVDTWATVGSCAQIGKNVHLSGGVGIGGVLEPMQAGPTIIEGDSSFMYAERGYHDTQSKESRLSQNAFIQNKTNILRGDSIFYSKVLNLSKAFRNVLMTDTANDVYVTGEFAIYDKNQLFAYVVDSAQAIFALLQWPLARVQLAGQSCTWRCCCMPKPRSEASFMLQLCGDASKRASSIAKRKQNACAALMPCQ